MPVPTMAPMPSAIRCGQLRVGTRRRPASWTVTESRDLRRSRDMQASEGVTENDKSPSVTERSAALPLTGVMADTARAGRWTLCRKRHKRPQRRRLPVTAVVLEGVDVFVEVRAATVPGTHVAEAVDPCALRAQCVVTVDATVHALFPDGVELVGAVF